MADTNTLVLSDLLDNRPETLLRLKVPGKGPLLMSIAQWYALGEKAHTLGVESGTIESSDVDFEHR